VTHATIADMQQACMQMSQSKQQTASQPASDMRTAARLRECGFNESRRGAADVQVDGANAAADSSGLYGCIRKEMYRSQ